MTVLERWAHAFRTALTCIILLVVLVLVSFHTAKYFFAAGYAYKECSKDVQTYGPMEDYSWLIREYL